MYHEEGAIRSLIPNAKSKPAHHSLPDALSSTRLPLQTRLLVLRQLHKCNIRRTRSLADKIWPTARTMAASIQHRCSRHLFNPINRDMPHNQSTPVILECKRDGAVLALIPRSVCDVAARAFEVGQVARGSLYVEGECGDGYAGRLVRGEGADLPDVGAGSGERAGTVVLTG
jgi:hypothetical protein